MKNLKQINMHFKNFIDHIDEVMQNIGEESEYTKGYLECTKDMIEASLSEESTGLLKMIEKRNEMKYRQEAVNELIDGFKQLAKAYEKLEEE